MESQALVKPQGRIESFDVQGDGFAESSGFPQQIRENRAADSGAAEFGQQGNIHQPDLRGSVVEIDAADGRVVAQDNLKRRIAIMLPVVRGLKLKLLAEERVLLRCV